MNKKIVVTKVEKDIQKLTSLGYEIIGTTYIDDEEFFVWREEDENNSK